MPSALKRWLKDIAIALALLPLAIGGIALATGDYWYAYSFEQIEAGSTKAAVVERLGDPDITSKDCYVAQWVDFENPAKWSEGAHIAYCALWRGPGVVPRSFAVGFDENDKVIGVAYGSS